MPLIVLPLELFPTGGVAGNSEAPFPLPTHDKEVSQLVTKGPASRENKYLGEDRPFDLVKLGCTLWVGLELAELPWSTKLLRKIRMRATHVIMILTRQEIIL